MIICIQKVSRASVKVEDSVVAEIGPGLLLLVGIEKNDTEKSFPRAAEKIVNLRIFPDDQDKMNLSLLERGGEILAVSQFTLAGTIRKGRRPSFDNAAPPEDAALLFNRFIEVLKEHEIVVKTGVFQAFMEVELVNDGPVTFIGQW